MPGPQGHRSPVVRPASPEDSTLSVEREQSYLAEVLENLSEISHGCTGVREVMQTDQGQIHFSVISVSSDANFKLKRDRRFDHDGPAIEPISGVVDREATLDRFENLVGPPPLAGPSGIRSFGLRPEQFATGPRGDLVAFTPNSYGLQSGEFLIFDQRLVPLKGDPLPCDERALLAMVKNSWEVVRVSAVAPDEVFHDFSFGFSLPVLSVDPLVCDIKLQTQDQPRVLEMLGGDPSFRSAAQIVGLDRDGKLKAIFVDGVRQDYSIGANISELRTIAAMCGLRFAGLSLVGPDVHLLVKNGGVFDQGNSPCNNFDPSLGGDFGSVRGIPAQLQVWGN